MARIHLFRKDILYEAKAPNTASRTLCRALAADHRDKYAPDPPLRESAETMAVGLPLSRRAHALRAVRQFAWLGVGSGKVALSRPRRARDGA